MNETIPAVPAASSIGKPVSQITGDHLDPTPGPWSHEHRQTRPDAYNTEVFDKDGVTIATISWYPVKTKDGWATNRDANARFIAAAPDLESALEPFADIDGEGDEDFPDDTKVIVKFGRTTFFSLTLGDFRRARAAIAKATGATP